jgi:hypothetical protein
MARHDVSRAFLAFALLGVAMSGCASTADVGTPMAVGPDDVRKLAGPWQGYVSGTSGGGHPATLTIKPDGTYDIRGGAFSASGVMQAQDGRLIVTNTATSGIPPEKRVSEAVVTAREGRWVITGHGHSDRGPFSYELIRAK